MLDIIMYMWQRKAQFYKTDSRKRLDMFQFPVARCESHLDKGYGGIEKS